MFCDQCGAQLDPNARFCNRCGKQLSAPVAFAAPRPGRVQSHVRLLGILWLALSAFDAVGACHSFAPRWTAGATVLRASSDQGRRSILYR